MYPYAGMFPRRATRWTHIARRLLSRLLSRRTIPSQIARLGRLSRQDVRAILIISVDRLTVQDRCLILDAEHGGGTHLGPYHEAGADLYGIKEVVGMMARPRRQPRRRRGGGGTSPAPSRTPADARVLRGSAGAARAARPRGGPPTIPAGARAGRGGRRRSGPRP